jgi:beta-galactosidase
MNTRKILCIIGLGLVLLACQTQVTGARQEILFNQQWRFHLGDVRGAEAARYDDTGWRSLELPHDWSIEGDFNADHPATPGGGALPGGVGWYRKSFRVSGSEKGKQVAIDFDGIYMNSEVWVNGQYLGRRPNGYISFRYDLTPFIKFGEANNIIAVRVDNSKQPNSRWYSGSGIYRNVRLQIMDPVHIAHWGTFITTPVVTDDSARVRIATVIENHTAENQPVSLTTRILDGSGKEIGRLTSNQTIQMNASVEIPQTFNILKPVRWSIDRPALYKAVMTVHCGGKLCDDYETVFGIRTFRFDAAQGFFLNEKPLKIKGVCNHHDMGCLGTAINNRALERQLEIMKAMGVNSLRTSHNPPAPELLDLCDRMGILVLNEMFDMWKRKKSPFDYAMYWDDWHEKDLRDFILRDRNHASVFIWSIGNEILEQWDSTGVRMARELAGIVRELDPTRPITSGCNDPKPHNSIIRSGALDLIGFNYHHEDFEAFPEIFPGQKFIATETNSGLATRGHYDMPSDSIRRWPLRWDRPFTAGNPDNTCSAYDNCCTPWGSTQEETWKIVRKHAFLSGIYIWTGFDYLGEPTPYGWPSRSSYFGLVDLAGFPKDTYFFYQSEWTDEPMLHIFPHWNWQSGDTVDVWAYSNCDSVELFLNGKSRGSQARTDDCRHMMWRVAWEPGSIRAIGRTSGKEVLSREIQTAGDPVRIELTADRSEIRADGLDLSFISVRIVDAEGRLCPLSDNEVKFEVQGAGWLRATDNGLQTSHESFQSSSRKAFNGLCLAVIQSTDESGRIQIKATSSHLKQAVLNIQSR